MHCNVLASNARSRQQVLLIIVKTDVKEVHHTYSRDVAACYGPKCGQFLTHTERLYHLPEKIHVPYSISCEQEQGNRNVSLKSNRAQRTELRNRHQAADRGLYMP